MSVAATKRIVRRFEKRKPENERDALIECDVSLRHIDSGAFRDVYQVDDLPLIVKFPRENCEHHSRREIRVYRKVVRSPKRYPVTRSYLPVFLYANIRSGVILMPLYEDVSGDTKTEAALKAIGASVSLELKLPNGWDDWPQNFGTDAKGNVVLLDMGCLEETSDFVGFKAKGKSD